MLTIIYFYKYGIGKTCQSSRSILTDLIVEYGFVVSLECIIP